MSNISINNINPFGSGNFICSVTGIPGHKNKNVKLSNFNIMLQGGLKEGDYLPSVEDVEEKIKAYPQLTKWGNLPVSGLFIRHVNGIMAHNVNDSLVKDLLVGKINPSVPNSTTYKFNITTLIDFNFN